MIFLSDIPLDSIHLVTKGSNSLLVLIQIAYSKIITSITIPKLKFPKKYLFHQSINNGRQWCHWWINEFWVRIPLPIWGRGATGKILDISPGAAKEIISGGPCFAAGRPESSDKYSGAGINSDKIFNMLKFSMLFFSSFFSFLSYDDICCHLFSSSSFLNLIKPTNLPS